jgi:hypothetical protein
VQNLGSSFHFGEGFAMFINVFMYFFPYVSVADSGCLSWIPDPNFFHPGTQFQDQQVPGFQIRIRNISILTQKSFLGFWKYDPIPDPDLDPQHWFLHGSKY